MSLFKIITKFISEKYNDKNPFQFLFDINELISSNLLKYKNVVDVLNFKEIFEEVLYYIKLI